MLLRRPVAATEAAFDEEAGVAKGARPSSVPEIGRASKVAFSPLVILKQSSPAFFCLLALWIVFLVFGELVMFQLAFLSCHWPTHPLDLSDTVVEEEERVALIADPQLTDRFSYHFMKSGGLLAQIVQFHSDLYMRRCFRLLQRWMTPSTIFILGDLLDSAKWLGNVEYEDEVERYQQLFKLVDPNTRIYTISGNHDVGFKIPTVMQLTERYERTFGPVNNRVQVGQFEFILLSSASLEMKEHDTSTYEKTLQFMRTIQQDGSPRYKPRVLLTHVPLWRPSTASCGQLRKSSTAIPNCQGFSYKCLIGEELTRDIFEKLRPVLVFSGDDHDQCVVLHSSESPTRSFYGNQGTAFYSWDTAFYEPVDQIESANYHEVTASGAVMRSNAVQSVTIDIHRLSGLPQKKRSTVPNREVGIVEQTVGTFSFLQGNLQPSFAMLSLYSSKCGKELGGGPTAQAREGNKCDHHRIAVDVCLLPRQLVMYAWYGILALFSILVLTAAHLYRWRPSIRSSVRSLLRESAQLLAICLPLYLFCIAFAS